MKMVYVVLTSILVVGVAAAREHQVRLQINSYGDNIGWHFSKYNGRVPAGVQIHRIKLGFKLGKSSFTRILSEDDTNHRMARGERFDKTVPVTGPGIYILDFPDWNHTARVEVALNVDGQDWFRGSGASKNLSNWTTEMGKWLRHVRQTDDREITFYLD
jgi:hypothetical protein